MFNEILSVDPTFFVVFFYYAGFILAIVAVILGISKLITGIRKKLITRKQVLAHNVHE